MKKIVKNKWFIFGLCSFMFFLFLAFVWFKKDLYFDELVYSLISKIKTDRMTSIVLLITSIGNPLSFILITLILLVAIPNKKIAKNICLNLVLITITNYLIKLIVSRPRPIGINIIEEIGYSFPSAHAMVSVAFYGLLIFYILTYMKKKRLKYALSIMIGIMVFLVCMSRIYLGVHYASDVFAGIFLSLSYLILYIHWIKRDMKKLK